MKKRILSSLLIAFAFAITAFAQTTALVSYEGGYFIKNGDNWTEYRPQDKAEPCNEYKQYKENDTQERTTVRETGTKIIQDPGSTV